MRLLNSYPQNSNQPKKLEYPWRAKNVNVLLMVETVEKLTMNYSK